MCRDPLSAEREVAARSPLPDHTGQCHVHRTNGRFTALPGAHVHCSSCGLDGDKRYE